MKLTNWYRHVAKWPRTKLKRGGREESLLINFKLEIKFWFVIKERKAAQARYELVRNRESIWCKKFHWKIHFIVSSASKLA